MKDRTLKIYPDNKVANEETVTANELARRILTHKRDNPDHQIYRYIKVDQPVLYLMKVENATFEGADQMSQNRDIRENLNLFWRDVAELMKSLEPYPKNDDKNVHSNLDSLQTLRSQLRREGISSSINSEGTSLLAHPEAESFINEKYGIEVEDLTDGSEANCVQVTLKEDEPVYAGKM